MRLDSFASNLTDPQQSSALGGPQDPQLKPMSPKF